MNARRPIYRSARSNRGRIAASRFRPATAGKEAAFDLLLAPLGAEPSVSAECLFADPIGDIAVLGPPDGQELPDLWEAYDRLVESADTLMIADAPKQVPRGCFRSTIDGSNAPCGTRAVRCGYRTRRTASVPACQGHRCSRTMVPPLELYAQARATTVRITLSYRGWA